MAKYKEGGKPDGYYWAAAPRDEIGSQVQRAVEDFYEYCESSGRSYLWRKMHNAYNRAAEYGAEVQQTGSAGELSHIHLNHIRNLITHMTNLTLAQRPSFQPRATNTDHKSQAQTLLARGILDYELSEKKLEEQMRHASQYALTYGDSAVTALWNAKQGDEVMRLVTNERGEESYEVITDDAGNTVYSGDIEYRAVPAYDLIRDPSHESIHDQDWVIVRDYVNRYDLIAMYADVDSVDPEDFETQEEYDEIIGSIQDAKDCILNAADKNSDVEFRFNVFNDNLGQDSEEIPVYYFFHRRSPSMPEGRIAVVVGDGDCVLEDGPLPYEKVPVYFISPGQTTGTPLGYTPAFDCLVIQQVLDATHSTIVTNQRAFGVQNVLVPQGSNISAPQLIGGLNMIPYVPDVNGGKPEALQLLSTPAEIFAYANTMEQQMETLMGISAVVRGETMDGNMSGTAMALSASTSIQFSQEFQQSYIHCLEQVGQGIISIYQTYADIPRTVVIVGKSKGHYIKEFTRDDLANVDRVTVDVGSPMSRTVAGKVQIAQDLLNMGMIKTPEQYIQVLQTGNLDTMLEGDTSELMNIRAENEFLDRGEDVPVVVTDNHLLHIQEHKAVLASPEARKDPTILAATLQHINEHITMLQDPNLMALNALLGQPQVPQQAPQVPQPSVSAADVAAQDTTQVLNNQNPIVAEAAGANLPGLPPLPMNPLTGERYNPETGGMPE